MYRLYHNLLLLFIFFCCFNFAFSQDQSLSDGESAIFKDELLENLIGIWELTGVVAGDSVVNTFEARWVLNHQFLQLHYKDVNVPSQYEALVYVGFNHQENRYVVHWLDIFGGSYSEILGFGRRENNSITFVFKSSDSLLHNTFKWFPNQQKWVSYIKQQDQDGKWQSFAIQEIHKKTKRKR